MQSNRINTLAGGVMCRYQEQKNNRKKKTEARPKYPHDEHLGKNNGLPPGFHTAFFLTCSTTAATFRSNVVLSKFIIERDGVLPVVFHPVVGYGQINIRIA